MINISNDRLINKKTPSCNHEGVLNKYMHIFILFFLIAHHQPYKILIFILYNIFCKNTTLY